jgi:alpha-glucosidase
MGRLAQVSASVPFSFVPPMPDLYPEPPASCSALTLKHVQEHVALMETGSGHLMEVMHLAGIGWSLEVRYDESMKGIVRQPFTGLQQECRPSDLEGAQSSAQIILTSGDESLVFQRKTGAFQLRKKDAVLLSSCEPPFSLHAQPVKLFTNIGSLKLTDFTGKPWFSTEQFDTHMVRFQYGRPKGTVLGLPGHTGEMNRNGYRFELCNGEQAMHVPTRKPMYQSWPILIHQAEDGKHFVGVFFDNPSQTFVDVGDFYKDRVTFESVTGNARVYLTHGKTRADVARKWVFLLGAPELPPLWAFGYQQCRWSYLSTDEIRSVGKRLRQEDIPCDALYFDIDYMDGYRVFTHDPKNFADLDTCIADLQKEGFQAMCIMDPGVKVDDKYPLYNELKETGAYFKTATGEDLYGFVWPGKVLIPDFGSQKVEDLWALKQKEFLDKFPFAGVWNDMNEPINWDGGHMITSKAITERGNVKGEWNLYGYHMARASAKGWKMHRPLDRPLIISRSGYPGVQRHAIVWHGDNHAWWEHLRLAIDTTIVYGMCGAFYTGPDVPGFSENPPADLAVRFFQMGSVLPFFRGHSIMTAEDKEPYAYPEPYKSLIRAAIKLRYSLLREWYSGFERAVREKMPPLQPVFDGAGNLVRDSFLLFDKFLVCPVTQRDETMKKVWLPKGEWYAFGDPKKRFSGSRYIFSDVSDLSMPLFVRAGSIVVLHTPKRNTADTLKTKEKYVVYPDAKGSAHGYIYSDDGIHVSDPGIKRTLLTIERRKKMQKRLL